MSYWKIGWMVYLIQLLFVLPVGFQVYQVMEASIGQSMTLSQLMKGFDYSVIQDFLNVHGESISSLIGNLRWFVLIYLLISAYVSGGVWYCLIGREGSWRQFRKGALMFFRKFLLIDCLFMFLFVIWSSGVWIYYLSSFFRMMETWLDDSRIVHLGIVLFIIWMFGLTFLFVWTSFSKIRILKGASLWQAFKGGGREAIKRYLRLLPTLLLFSLIILALYIVELWMERTLGITSAGLILLFVIIQQGIIWLKIMLRIAVYQYLLDA